MRYCIKCCQPDTRPKIYFDENGVCGACLWEEEKKTIDWGKREQELHSITERAKKKAIARDTYDCVIGASGGKDTTFTALYARDKLGLNCLLVNAAPAQITPVGQRNIDNLQNLGFDMFTIKVNPEVLRQLIKRDFYKYLNISKPTEYPLWSSAYHIAKAYGIPLIIQGENAALTLGVREGFNLDGDASQVYKNNTLAGGDAYTEYAGYNGITKQDLLLYQFPNMSGWQGEAIWLQYYVKEWSQIGNGRFATNHGVRGRNDTKAETGMIHNDASLDSDFYMVNQMFKYVKLGFGSATDHVCYDIREGLNTRRKGFKIIKKYDGVVGQKYINNFCKYIHITTREFWETVERFRNTGLFEMVEGKWKLKSDYS